MTTNPPVLTMRQYYKAAIITGIMANSDYLIVVAEKASLQARQTAILALHAAELADALLAEDEEREKK